GPSGLVEAPPARQSGLAYTGRSLLPRPPGFLQHNSGTQFGDRATFDITFRYPKTMTFVGTGTPVASASAGADTGLAKWTSGSTELAVAGFNYGKFKKKAVTDKESGYEIEFYANDKVPDELRGVQAMIDEVDREGNSSMTTLGSVSTTRMADSMLADAQNATRLYNSFFGKLPYSRLAITQQPAAFFGQAWPTLVYMPYTAFMDATQRAQLFGARGGTDTSWEYVGPHEIAHQWWGHLVGWKSYHDQWMSEGFSEFSASLFVQFILKDTDKFVEFWENQRKRIVESSPATLGRKPFMIGPVTQGFRLSSAKTGAVYPNLVYPKGAYILHMLRMLMYDRRTGDAQFMKMMKDFVRTHFNKDVSTGDFKRIVEKHMTKEMDVDQNGRIDWFFDQWVYGTEVPSYNFDYKIASDGSLSGRISPPFHPVGSLEPCAQAGAAKH
ncbi:MAG: hypothetical protein HY650_16765, partial [Acidobacteria bacterium]|nr:hypothetical protein [Acidobacteriota bacterium]